MELLAMLSVVPVPVVVVVFFVLFLTATYLVFQYAKLKKLDGIRKKAYEYFLKAEHLYVKGEGEEKLKWVISQVRELFPRWLRVFVTEKELEALVEYWFQGIKDLLDDGKINGSSK